MAKIKKIKITTREYKLLRHLRYAATRGYQDEVDMGIFEPDKYIQGGDHEKNGRILNSRR